MKSSLIYFAMTMGLGLACIFIRKESSLYMFTPAMAALVMLLVAQKKHSLKITLSELGILKGGFRWCLPALVLPILVLSISYLAIWRIDPQSFHPWKLGFNLANTSTWFLTSVASQTVSFSMGEELGWRGYMLPKLLAEKGRCLTYTLVGIAWALWHYPLIFFAKTYNTDGNIIWTTIFFTMTVIALSFITCSLREKSSSVWIPSIFHSSHNVIWNIYGSASTATPIMIYAGGESGILTMCLYIFVAVCLYPHAKNMESVQSTSNSTQATS